MKIQLGMKASDLITGFEGVVVGYCTYISGCNQVLLTPPVDEKGAHRESHWFDEQRLVVVGNPDHRIVLDNGTTSGFDKPAPKR